MAQIKNSIFHKKKLKYQIEKINFNDISDFQNRWVLVNKWIGFVNSESFYKSKETELQGNFLFDIFGKVLGYSSKLNNPSEWNLNQEQVTTVGGKFADGSLGFYNVNGEIIRVVIELKDPNTNLDERQHRHNDNRTPVEQAFGYQHRIGKDCKWVIVSNFNEIRLYHHSSSIEFEQFFIKELASDEKLKRFFFLLGKDNLIAKEGNSLIDSLFISNEQDEQEITKKFYAAFKDIRLKFFDHLKTNNPTIDENILLEKTQKLLDRFIFICFAEDNRLLPETIFKNMVKAAKLAFSYSETKVWTELKGLFSAINIGSPPHNINKFNGGLFAADEVLDSLQIKDQILEELSNITDYDFESDVSIDILGHIFEQSISDLEEIKASINGEVFEKSKSKRKRDGIVYTPAYITRDIVEKAVGGWLEDRRIELGYYDLSELTDEDYKTIINNRGKITYNEKVKQHLEFWYAYRDRLMNIKVLDPACGSGAFLIQVFDFLYAEGNKVNDKIAKLLGGQYEVFQLDKHILSNNIYGVDINSESVEITKLSLWLKTANKNAELTSLDNNIKCGNSLIDDPEVAGDKAFDWNKEFPEIMQDKVINEDLKAYHVTWATFNSRPVGFTNYGSPIILNDETRNQLAEYLDEKIGIEHYRVIAINVLKDHVHCIVVCKEEDLSEIVRNLKGFSSYKLHRDSSSVLPKLKLGVDTDNSITINPTLQRGELEEGHVDTETSITINPTLQRGELKDRHGELGNERGKKDRNSKTPSQKLWAKGYSHTFLNDDSHYLNTIHYIDNNHLKHEQSQLEYKFQNLTPLGEAFAPVVLRGGFDVVVGNPPYVRADTDNEEFIKQREWLTQNYKTLYEKWDLMTAFFEKGLLLLKEKGYFGFIASNSITTSKFAFRLQDWIINNFNCRSIDYYDNFEIFQNVGVVPVTIVIDKNKLNQNIPTKKIYRKFSFNDVTIKEINFYDLKDSTDDEKRSAIFKKEFTKGNTSIEYNLLGDICYMSVGMVINADEKKAKGEFDKDDLISEICDISHPKRYVEGKDLKKYKVDKIRFLEWNSDRVPSKIRRPTFQELYEGEKILRGRVTEGIYDDTGIICNDSIVVFKRYIDLNGVNNLSINNSITKNSSLKREELESISSKFNLKYILAILNSKYAIKYLNNIRRHRLENYFYPDDFRKLPIANIDLEAQQPFITLADTMLDKNKELQEKNSKFQELLKADFNIEKLNTKLENWYNLSWSDFVNELKKLKITLSGEMKEDWIERFNRYKSQITELQNIIQYTDKKIDQLVYQLYGLTEEEIKVVEGE